MFSPGLVASCDPHSLRSLPLLVEELNPYDYAAQQVFGFEHES